MVSCVSSIETSLARSKPGPSGVPPWRNDYAYGSCGRVRQKAPNACGGPAAKDRLVAERQERGALHGQGWRDRMSNQVHALMDLVKTASAKAPGDLTGRDSLGKQLPARDDTVLPASQLRDDPIGAPR
jgi:hypothetical protein